MSITDKKKMVQDWLDHPAWDVIKDEIIQEIEAMTQKMINGEVELRFDIKARQMFLDKIQKYNG